MIAKGKIEVVNLGTSVDVEAAPVVAKIRYSRGICAALFRGLSVNYHRDILLLNFLVVASAAVLLWVSLTDYQDYYSTVTPIAILVGIMSYYPYLRNCSSSATLAYLSSPKDTMNIYDYVQQVLVAEPVITEDARCFHNETRTQQVSYTEYEEDMHGNTTAVTKYRTETYTEMVNKHFDSIKIPYSRVIDVSVLPDLSSYSICELTCSKQWTPTDASQPIYDEVKQRFHNKHASCDAARAFSSTLTLPGFKEKLLAYVSENDVPFVIRHGKYMYYLCTIIPINWLFRVYVTGICGQMNIEFKKVVDVINNE